MASNDDVERYLFDSHALERSFAEGSDDDHQKLLATESVIWVTADTKADFIDAFPKDKDIIAEYCHLAPLRTEDRKLAAIYTDRLQNVPDIDDADVQDKLLLVAVAKRLDATIVTGEGGGGGTPIAKLAELLDWPHMTADELLRSL